MYLNASSSKHLVGALFRDPRAARLRLLPHQIAGQFCQSRMAHRIPVAEIAAGTYIEHDLQRGQTLDEKLARKLRILADAAKYDASCASSGAPKRVAGVEGIGSTSNGICHAYTPDGRCVSLLKILLTNYCQFDCAYCINRVSSNISRARFRVEDVVTLTIEFYKRNYIEGLFLSSGIGRRRCND
jgi:hypothetical protein